MGVPSYRLTTIFSANCQLTTNFMSFPVNIHSINMKNAGVGQPKYCNNAYVHVVLTNLCRYFLFLKFFGLVTIYFDPT